MTNLFNLDGRVAVITGAAGLLGKKHAEAIAGQGGTPVLWDINFESVNALASSIVEKYKSPCIAVAVDVTSQASVNDAFEKTIASCNDIDILINNAAINPKVEEQNNTFQRLEHYDMNQFQNEFRVGLTGALICSQIVGYYMSTKNKGVIINIASDLALIAPDQRIYKKTGLSNSEQKVKPVSYSIIKHALIGLTKYLATYWVENNVRCNALAPGGVFNQQPEEFVQNLLNLIPMKRMANEDEYMGAIQFLCSDASKYMNGATLVMDGGRSCW